MTAFYLMGALSGVLLGALLLRALGFRCERKPAQPLPCIGQHWQLRGVGRVQIVGLQLHNDGEIYAVKYTHRAAAGRVLFEGGAPLKAFLESAVLVEPPTAPYQALPSPVSDEVH